MPKPLTFKGDAKPKKRKRTTEPSGNDGSVPTRTPTSGDGDGAEGEDKSWVTADSPNDITGPIVLVFSPPTSASRSERTYCLAVDASGAIFASPLNPAPRPDDDEREEEKDDVAVNPEEAEPSSVQQVWVAARVAGQREISLKAWTGRYLGASAEGRLEARREARGVEEGFELEEVVTTTSEIPREDDGHAGGRTAGDEAPVVVHAGGVAEGRFRVKTSTGRYVALARSQVDGGKMVVHARTRRDAAEGGAGEDGTVVTVRMQARFKPRLAAARREKAYEKVSRATLEKEAGRTLKDDEVKRLKRARREGGYREAILDIRAKGAHDKFA